MEDVIAFLHELVDACVGAGNSGRLHALLDDLAGKHKAAPAADAGTGFAPPPGA
jgi:hypothetical protein